MNLTLIFHLYIILFTLLNTYSDCSTFYFNYRLLISDYKSFYFDYYSFFWFYIILFKLYNTYSLCILIYLAFLQFYSHFIAMWCEKHCRKSCRESMGSECCSGLMFWILPLCRLMWLWLSVHRDVLPGCWVKVWWCAGMCCRGAGSVSECVLGCVATVPD